MLQLSGTLSNATVRITPKISWWITAQHLLSASSLSAIPNPAENSTKEFRKVVKKTPIKQRPVQNAINSDGSLITAVFKSLLEPAAEERTIAEENVDLKKKIEAAKTVDELLTIANHPQFNTQNAYSVVYVLCNWITAGKIKMTDIQTDIRYLKICAELGIKANTSIIKKESTDTEYSSNSEYLYGILRTEKTKKQIEAYSTIEKINVLTALAAKQSRSTPLLKIIASEIILSKETLGIKKLADILYSLAVLNFYDQELMQKISKDLSLLVPENKKNAVIASILTSFGVLRYRNEDVLNLLSSWTVENKDIITPQNISSLMRTLAHLGYTPTNFDEVMKQIIVPLKESEMCKSSEWLDIVWALTVLNQATSEHYASVLNSGFLSRIIDVPESERLKAFKILNVNAAARLRIKDYTGPLLPEDSRLYDVTILKAKEMASLSISIISALKILLPSDSIYLNININTRMGFCLDAEFCVNSKCTPVPINLKTEHDKPIFRIAVLTCSYHEFSRGTETVLGSINLRKSLLEKQGYNVLLIPYTEVNIKAKLAERVDYLNKKIKLLVKSQSS